MPLVSFQGCFVPLTSDNSGSGNRYELPLMAISERDSLAVRLVGSFQQASASHLRELVYYDVSRERARQLLSRLVKHKYLRRLKRRLASEQSGSGAYVYQLGEAGWWLCGKRGDFRHALAIDEHALMVIESYIEVVKAERAGYLQLMPDDGCQLEVHYGIARADLALHVAIPAINKLRRFCVEVEATDKSPSKIREKCENYVAQMRDQDGGMLPLVVFVAPAGWVKARIGRTLRAVEAEYQDMFTVCLMEEFAGLITAP